MKLALIVSLSFCSLTGYAGTGKTCADSLRGKARLSLAVGVPVALVPPLGFVAGGHLIEWSVRWRHDAKRLSAAHILANRELYSEKRVKRAERILKAYYNDLTRIYSTRFTLAFHEVVSVLNEVYLTGVANGYCEFVAQYYLTQSVFEGGTLKFYKHFKESFEISEKAKELAEKIRNAKNCCDANAQDLLTTP